jgi:hypothetical protein
MKKELKRKNEDNNGKKKTWKYGRKKKGQVPKRMV